MNLPWDTEIDTPATIAVIGGGACGVEAAVYGRFLGYSVELYDQDKVGDSLLCWEHRSMPGTWKELVSPLGLAAIEAHEHPLPNPQVIPSCKEYVEQYLLPLARTDLLYSSITVHTKLLSISRLGCQPRQDIPVELRADQEFRLLLESSQRGQFSQVVDIVLDCSGAESQRQGLASGGGLPLGWSHTGDRVLLGRRRVATRERERFAGKRVLLFGDDLAAHINAIELAQLAESTGTRLIWVQPKHIGNQAPAIPIVQPTVDLWSEELQQAKQIFQQADGLAVVAESAWGIEALQNDGERIIVTLQSTEDQTLDFNVDHLIHCGPVTLDANYHHCLSLEPHGDSLIVTHEPHFYRLGDRCNLGPLCSMQRPFDGLRQQIREAYRLIGGRAELDLYQTVKTQAVW